MITQIYCLRSIFTMHLATMSLLNAQYILELTYEGKSNPYLVLASCTG